MFARSFTSIVALGMALPMVSLNVASAPSVSLSNLSERASAHPEFQVKIKKPVGGTFMGDFLAQWSNQCTHATVAGCEDYTEAIDEEIAIVYCICPLKDGLWDDRTDKYIGQLEATRL
ncbi:hypothetical protein IAT40_001739 [Kwoniella sp. CBS 6097]